MRILKSKDFRVALVASALGGVLILQTNGSQIAAAPVEGVTSSTSTVMQVLDDRSDIRESVSKLVADRNIDGLEALSVRMRDNDERTNEGWARLTSFYDGVNVGLSNMAKSTGTESVNTFLADWKKAKPESKTALIADGNFKIKEAWKIRGNSEADKVTAAQWDGFRTITSDARSVLNQARTAPGKYDPQAAVGLLQIGMSLGMPREERDEIVNECIERYPTYEGMYRAMTITLMHRWQGDDGDAEKFAADMQKRLPKPLGDIIYNRIFGAAWNYEGKEVFSEYNFSYPSILAGYNAIFSQYPDTINTRMGLAYLATRFDDRETAGKMLEDTKAYWHIANINGLWGNKLTYDKANAWVRNEGANPLLPAPVTVQTAIGSGNATTTVTNIRTSSTPSM